MTAGPETVFIGDVHGCAREFELLLSEIPSGSRIVLLGDLVNKGPDPARVLETYRSLGCLSLRGNHDADHWKWNVEGRKPKPDTVATRKKVPAKLYLWYLEAVFAMPLMLRDPGFVALHGALLTDVPLDDQPEDILTGEMTIKNSWKDRIDLGVPLVVGHKRYNAEPERPMILGRRFFGIDTGCVYGGALTALSLPSGAIRQVPAARSYAPRD